MNLWQRFCDNLISIDSLGFSLDISRVRFPDNYLTQNAAQIEKALLDMKDLEAGSIANPDEGRKVGHYWLRNIDICPDKNLANEIVASINSIKNLAKKIHSGEIKGSNGKKFSQVLLVGIGGSALGPQLVSDALGTTNDKLKLIFVDNTDPDGIERIYQEQKSLLDETLVLVVSKSGGTVETRNGMLEFEKRYSLCGLKFANHAIAVTCQDSKLDQYANANSWLDKVYMWDWVGGRTSLYSAVGLLPAALQGFDIDQFIEGARIMDIETRNSDPKKNPALTLALMWLHLGNGKGEKDMVVLPYKDRLVLFSKYLQQLVMESLGKELDLKGNKVNQGIAVYGNKGSTDQHAYIQQLRDGLNNFFAVFIQVLEDVTSSTSKETETRQMQVEENVTSGDYLNGFFQGTRKALYENDRDSITISIKSLNATSLGALIALFERAVSFYASFTNINAYHQPGVEAGKKAATKVIEIQKLIISELNKGGSPLRAIDIANKISLSEEVETVYFILEHLSANNSKIKRSGGAAPNDVKYSS